MVRVQWWVLVKKGSKLNERHLYVNCWNGKWKCNLAYLEQWLDISAICFSFSVQKNTTNKSQINILATYASRAKVNLNATNVSNNLWRLWMTSMKLYISNLSMPFVSIVMIILSFIYFFIFVCCIVAYIYYLENFIPLHSWRLMINNLICSTLTLIFGGYQASPFFLHGM